MHLRYLHISDLHLTGQRADKSSWAVEQFDQHLVTRSMLDAITKLVKKGSHGFDLVFITGDLAKRGQPDEYRVAEVFCEQLLEAARMPHERLFLVPGNHDVDRSQVKEHHVRRWYEFKNEDQVTEVLRDPDWFPILMRKFAPFNVFAKWAMGRLVYTDNDYFYTEKVLVERGGDKILVNIVGLNSALFAGYDGDDQKKLAFGLPQLDGALAKLDDSALLTIVLFHHPFSCFHPADKVCQNLLMQKANLILIGHLHKPANMFVRGAAGQAVLVRAGASFDKRESENWFNTGEIDLATGKGKVQFWKYLQDNHWKENGQAHPLVIKHLSRTRGVRKTTGHTKRSSSA